MKPSIGRIVHFVNNQKQHLAAIVTAVWTDTCVNLQVFTDGSNSGDNLTGNIAWVTSKTFDESPDPQVQTWHWPEKV